MLRAERVKDGGDMSRAMQLAMSESEVTELCAKQKVAVSAIESLPGGGVRLVCSSAAGAEIVRQKVRSKVINVEQPREKRRLASTPW
jgi:nicotinamide mononucleotide (NMN) deamidase PncC